MMEFGTRVVITAFCLWAFAGQSSGVFAQVPGHPVITEVYNNPNGANDGPVGRDPANLHQEFIEIYLPVAAGLDPGINKDALNLTFYEVEGDEDSNGYTLVNYRFDLPTFDLDPGNGLTPGAIARPDSGIVVLGWVDYVGDPPTALAGTPSTRVALINGGVTTSPTGAVFIAMNGHHFGGTTNFETLVAESLIHLPNEASSGVIQDGSGAYLLVNRDAPGYVELYDDEDTAHVPPIENADPSLPTGTVLQVSSFLDGVAGNDDSGFDMIDQPLDAGDNTDLADVLPLGGAYSLLIPQISERDTTSTTPSLGGGYARKFVDVLKTTETLATDDPVEDALNAYQLVRNNGPFFPTPGRAVHTTTDPELGVAVDSEQVFEVLQRTTGRPGILAANVGGNFAIDVAVTTATSDNSSVATMAPSVGVSSIGGQSFAFPSLAITPGAGAADGATTTGTADVLATNTFGGDPPVVGATHSVQVTMTVLDPTTGTDAGGQPFQATIFVAVQGIVDDPGVLNEFAQTDLGVFLAAQPDITLLETLGHGATLLNPATNIRDQLVVVPLVDELPADGEECTNWLNPSGALGTLDFAQTVQSSAENQTDVDTYIGSIGICNDNGETVIRAIRLNIPDAMTFGGSFSPSEIVHFAPAKGRPGVLRSGLTNATTSRTFEVALIDTAVEVLGGLETGATDDFGMIIEVLETEPGAPVVPGEFVAISFSGGLGLADIDTLQVPPGNLVATIIYLDLDNLHDVMGIRSIESLFIVDAREGGEVDIIEAFTLPAGGAGCTTDPDCDDNVFCNGMEQCVGNSCVAGVNPCVDDGNVCTDDSCDETNDVCDHTPNSDPCDDDDPCTNGDACAGGVCSGTVDPDCVPCNSNPDCDDSIGCTQDSCNLFSGVCEFIPDDFLCPDDGMFCNGVESCDPPNGDPTTGCISSGPPCPECTEQDGCPCQAPLVEAVGGKYLRITPLPLGSPIPMSFVVTCAGGTQKYVGLLPDQTMVEPFDLTNDGDIDGTVAGLVDTSADAVFRTPTDWLDDLYVTGAYMIPSTEYTVQADCGQPGAPNLTDGVTVITWYFGDVFGNGPPVSLEDAFAGVLAFQGSFTSAQGPTSRSALDLDFCSTNRVINLADVLRIVHSFQGLSYAESYGGSNCQLSCP